MLAKGIVQHVFMQNTLYFVSNEVENNLFIFILNNFYAYVLNLAAEEIESGFRYIFYSSKGSAMLFSFGS